VTWNSGTGINVRRPAPISAGRPRQVSTFPALARNASWVVGTPLGLPVVPDVQKNAATSLRPSPSMTSGSPSGKGPAAAGSTVTPASCSTNSTSGWDERVLTATATPPAMSEPQNALWTNIASSSLVKQ